VLFITIFGTLSLVIRWTQAAKGKARRGKRHGNAVGCDAHIHRIDKYLVTLLANQPISDGEATDRCQKFAPQDGGLPELIVARSCVTNHSEAASL